MQHHIRFLLALSAIFTSASVCANDGEYLGLRYQIDVSPGRDFGSGMLIQPDGKLLLAGTCIVPADSFCATRLNSDASYDPTFGYSSVGYETISQQNFPTPAQLSSFALTADGGSVLGGTNAAPSYSVGIVALLKPDGTLKGSDFEPGWTYVEFTDQLSQFASSIDALAVQPDRKIVVAGTAVRDGTGNEDFGVRRLNADLSIDMTFNNGQGKLVAFDLDGPSGANLDNASAIAIQSDGKIVVAGTSTVATSQ